MGKEDLGKSVMLWKYFMQYSISYKCQISILLLCIFYLFRLPLQEKPVLSYNGSDMWRLLVDMTGFICVVVK